MKEEYDKNFVKVYKLMTQKVLEDLRGGINGAVYVLWWFIDTIQDMTVDQDPIILVAPETIAKDLGISKRTVGHHLKTLKEYGYIEQIKKRHHIYRVNPMMVYKGDSDEE